MEPSGFEPETSTMLFSLRDMLRLRATNCAIAPCDRRYRYLDIIPPFAGSRYDSFTAHLSAFACARYDHAHETLPFDRIDLVLSRRLRHSASSVSVVNESWKAGNASNSPIQVQTIEREKGEQNTDVSLFLLSYGATLTCNRSQYDRHLSAPLQTCRLPKLSCHLRHQN